jgi:starch phosphorylase
MEPGIFRPLVDNLTYNDPFLVCADFDDYCRVQELVSRNYLVQEDWIEKAIINVAKSGKFSSDRTIMEYADDIWKIPYRKPS